MSINDKIIIESSPRQDAGLALAIAVQLAQDFITAEMRCRPIEPIISQFPHNTEAEAP